MIFKILITALIFGLILFFLAGFSIVSMLRGIFFGNGSRNRSRHGARTTNRRDYNNMSGSQGNVNGTGKTSRKKKIFTTEVGEYVDYEEVK